MKKDGGAAARARVGDVRVQGGRAVRRWSEIKVL